MKVCGLSLKSESPDLPDTRNQPQMIIDETDQRIIETIEAALISAKF
jgi:hypothetical protein